MAKIRRWEIWGAVITIIIGSLLHFIFNWSGQSKFVGLIGAVNESTWEHLKLAFWPTLFICIIEYIIFAKELKNFFLAMLAKLFITPLTIVILFYAWRAILPDNFIWDISIFLIGVILSYFIGYKIERIQKPIGWEKISLILIIVGIMKFSLFTYLPPKIFITKDPVKGGYGIEK